MLWERLFNKYKYYATINSSDFRGMRVEFYKFICEYLTTNIMKKNNNSIHGIKIYDVYRRNKKWREEKSLQYGTSYKFKIKGVNTIIKFYKKSDNADTLESKMLIQGASSNYSSCMDKKPEYIKILCTSNRDLKAIYDIFLDIYKDYVRKNSEKDVFIYTNERWRGYDKSCKKTFKNCIYSREIYNDVTKRIDNWLDSKDRYHELGIPYKIGFIFHGIPGTGKSSMHHCIASRYNMKTYIIDSKIIKNDNMMRIIGHIPKRSIILFEDIDIMIKDLNREKEKKHEEKEKESKSVIFKNILDILDGYILLNESIIIMTTNKIDDIDPAIIRPGRIDYKYKFGYCTEYQTIELCKLYDIDYDTLCSNELYLDILKTNGGITVSKLVKQFMC